MVFDIETVPDIEGGRRVYGLEGLSDAATAQAMFQLRMEKTGSDFLAHHLHRIVAISVVFRRADQLKVWSLGDLDSDEPALLRRFFDGIDRYRPTLVSWNGGGFDLPVIHYRALKHAIEAPRYWDVGDDQREFRFNNYLNRFHWLHTDLMDVLSGYQGRAVAPLNEIATLLGFPGKMGMDGSKVWEAYQAGNLGRIRDYCETDVLNTYLIYLRFEFLRGHLTTEAYAEEQRQVRALLGESEAEHLQGFLRAWNQGSP